MTVDVDFPTVNHKLEWPFTFCICIFITLEWGFGRVKSGGGDFVR